MILEEFISDPPVGYNGLRVGTGALKGQCGSLVRQYWIDVDQTNPPSYDNSKDYWFNPVPGYDKVSSPKPGDIAIYNGHTGYPEGHSAIYVDGRVFEQNADPDGSPAHLFNRTSPYLLGYLRKQGEDMVDDATARAMLTATTMLTQNGNSPDRQPTKEEIENLIGRTPLDAMNQIMSYEPWKHNVAKVKYYDADVAIAAGYVPVTEQLFKKG